MQPPCEGLRMPMLTANGIEIHYELRGSGTPLLLIAGFGCDHLIWVTAVPALAAQHQVILFDNRGTGRTSAPDRPYTVPEMAEDAAGLLDKLGVRQADVAGHSMGGQIALELALSHPDKVRSLTLLCSLARCDARQKALIETWGELPRILEPLMVARVIQPWMFTEAFYARPGAVDQLLGALTQNPFLPPAHALYHQSRAVSAADLSDRLGNVRCPTLVLAGREDILVPMHFAEELAGGIPNAELVVLEKVGHGMLIEAPAAVSGAILRFVGVREP
jgi:3-oxoadipate enol-lactonase